MIIELNADDYGEAQNRVGKIRSLAMEARGDWPHDNSEKLKEIITHANELQALLHKGLVISDV